MWFMPSRSRYGRSRYRGWHDDDEDSSAETWTEDHELDELIEQTVTLDSWLRSPGGKLEKVGLTVRGDELAASTRRES